MDIMKLQTTSDGPKQLRHEARKREIDAIFAAKERDKLSRFGLLRENPSTESESTDAD